MVSIVGYDIIPPLWKEACHKGHMHIQTGKKENIGTSHTEGLPRCWPVRYVVVAIYNCTRPICMLP